MPLQWGGILLFMADLLYWAQIGGPLKSKTHLIRDPAEVRTRPHFHAEPGYCTFPKKDGVPCKRTILTSGVCTSHLRSIGGHLFVFDNHDPGWYGEDEAYERRSFCRACGTVHDAATQMELCPARRNAPNAPCPPSPNLPSRLCYRFAKPEKGVSVPVGGQTLTGTKHGPFLAYRTEPDASCRDWRVLHLPSQKMVALLDSEKASLALMKEICHHGTELDFTHPMMMDHDARFHIRLAVLYLRQGRCVRAPGGVLSYSADHAYLLPFRITRFYWNGRQRETECWGPFGFEPADEGVILRPLEEPYHSPQLFRAPNHERAVAFAKAAAAMDLEWWTSSSTQEARWQSRTRRGVGMLLDEFPDVECLDPELVFDVPATLPAVPGKTIIEIPLATTEGPITVEAYAAGSHFAVHRPLSRKEAGYVLSHLPTGRCAGRSAELLPLFDAATELAELGDWSFTSLGDMSADLKAAPEVLHRHGVQPAGFAFTVRFLM